jgi:hypothetical protein
MKFSIYLRPLCSGPNVANTLFSTTGTNMADVQTYAVGSTLDAECPHLRSSLKKEPNTGPVYSSLPSSDPVAYESLHLPCETEETLHCEFQKNFFHRHRKNTLRANTVSPAVKAATAQTQNVWQACLYTCKCSVFNSLLIEYLARLNWWIHCNFNFK